MSELESFATYLELRESDEKGEASAGLSHTSEGLVLFHVLELAARGEPRGILTIVHDAGEHGGRSLDLAGVLAEEGWAVALPDLRGHGKSEGQRGHSAGRKEVVRDLDEVFQHLAYRLVGAPKTLIGIGSGALHGLALCADRPGLRKQEKEPRPGRPRVPWRGTRGTDWGGGGVIYPHTTFLQPIWRVLQCRAAPDLEEYYNSHRCARYNNT